jgi:hypothetical protein
VSRGPGKVELAVIEGIQRMPTPTTYDLACYVYNVGDAADLTAAQLSSVHRVLHRLKARGDVVERVPPRASVWELVVSAA